MNNRTDNSELKMFTCTPENGEKCLPDHVRWSIRSERLHLIIFPTRVCLQFVHFSCRFRWCCFYVFSSGQSVDSIQEVSERVWSEVSAYSSLCPCCAAWEFEMISTSAKHPPRVITVQLGSQGEPVTTVNCPTLGTETAVEMNRMLTVLLI